MKRKAYSRGEREEMILDAFYSMVGRGEEPYMTAYKMAKALDMNSGQHVRNILEGMVLDKRLTFWETAHRPGVFKRIYCPFPLIPIPWGDDPHEPTIRVNGKAV